MLSANIVSIVIILFVLLDFPSSQMMSWISHWYGSARHVYRRIRAACSPVWWLLSHIPEIHINSGSENWTKIWMVGSIRRSSYCDILLNTAPEMNVSLLRLTPESLSQAASLQTFLHLSVNFMLNFGILQQGKLSYYPLLDNSIHRVAFVALLARRLV